MGSVGSVRMEQRNPMAARPNPCAAFRSVPPPLPARRADAAPRPKDAPCPTSNGDRGLSGQSKKPPEHGMHKPSGGTYTKPDARVKLIPAEDITYVRHGKPFGRTVGSAKLQKRHCRRSVTPPPSSRKISLARSTPLTHKSMTPFTPKAMPPLNHKASTPLTHKATAPLTHKAATPLTHKPTTPPHPVASCLSPKRVETAHKASGPLSPKPTTPPLPVASCLSPKRIETAHKASGPLSPKPTTPPLPVASCLSPERVETVENRQFFSLNRPSPLYKAVQGGAFPPSVSQKESEMNPINPGSVHVPPAYSRKVPLNTKAEPPKSVITLDNKKLCSTSNQSALKCQPTKRDADPIVEKETTVKLPLLSPTSVLSSSSTEVCPDTGRSSSRLNLFDGKSKLDSLQPETNIPQAKSPESTTPTPCAQLSNDLRVVSSTKSHVEKQTNQEPSISRNMSSGAQLILHTPLCKETYQPEACWKGKFEITGELTHTCDGLEAYFPCEISSKVYEASKQMPEILKLEALPLSGLLPKKFKMEPPLAQDIGLCFISSCQRPNRDSYHLLENVSSHIGLRTDIGTVELLIFSSKLLTEDDQTKDGELYLFGVFQKRTRKRQHRVDSHTDISNVGLSKGDCNISEDIGLDLDMIGGKYTKGTTDSLCKSARRAPACGDLVLDPPSGFPLDVPPGFTRARCGLRRGKTAESHINSSPSLAFDTPGPRLDAPPGFTKAHGGSENGASTLFSERKSPIKFSLNITRPPGFAKLAEVKKEPGLPAFFKATEKTPPIGKANGKDIKHDKQVNVEVESDDSSEEREFPKTKRLSDILGSCASSSWRNNASTSAAPRNCSEVFRPATASKFEEQKQQHRHCRERGQQEASESDAAVEATKRLKVNGRIALNGCPALNSNQAQPKTPPT
ncbi:hypothetical protein CFC21_051363 [Triticum aestivum]|uniref:AIPP2-like SPOC-like domain-containing protein n=2 Tax=Triticum aestivum TaxID=4565 RepID=A0A9R1G7G7_WHEAT|nr:uncharacterized protein LOC123085073 isoform X5 [Triticum aestivum]KAF7041584.1 hypothetical protein CFC21_051363 [Triticum aestivum]